MPLSSSRRQFVVSSAAVAGSLTLSGLGAASESVTLQGTIKSDDGDPVQNARVAITEPSFRYVRTDSEGKFSTQVPSGTRVSMGFYKSDKDYFLAPRLDGVPHIQTLPTVTVGENGYDLGEYLLPKAYLLEARAVFANRPGGVEDAIPRFGSLDDGSYFASGYSYTTTNQDGYLKLNEADFTGVEMAGETRVWMYPPTYEPYEEQDNSDYAPYEEVDVTTLEVTKDTTIECDISRRKKN